MEIQYNVGASNAKEKDKETRNKTQKRQHETRDTRRKRGGGERGKQ
jgi:hypothetical protein